VQTVDYILNDVKPMTLNTSLEKLREGFRKNPYSHLPVLDEKVYFGALNRIEFDLIKDPNFKLQDHRALLEPFYVTDTMNWFEVLQYFATYNTNIMPILNSEKEYLGYFELDDFLNLFKCTPFLHEEGVILVVAKNANDYSFSEISQIVESNNATLFGAFVSKIEDDMAQITLKLSLHDINNTLHSFRRYNYEIINEFEKDKYIDELNQRSEYLQRYLNI
jgi:CBS domain-containing protein